MKSHDGQCIEAALSRGISEPMFLTAELPIKQDGTFAASSTYNEDIIVSDQCLRAAACMVPKVDGFVVAFNSWTGTI